MRILITLLIFFAAANGEHLAAQTQPQKNKLVITPLVSGVEASFRGLAVRNPEEAWITGSQGTVLRTRDSGQTWQRITIPDADKLDFRDVEVLGDDTVMLMSVGEGRASRLLRSVDNGDSWRTVLVNSDSKGFFDGMTFRDDGRNGWLFGDPINGRLDLYKTSDAGATWQRLPKQKRPKLNKGEYGFAASGTGIVARGHHLWVATGGSVARVLHSPDSAKTWHSYDTPIRHGNESSGIFSLDFIDDRRAVVIGGNYTQPELDRDNVATSSDGGKTWLAASDVHMPHKACVRSLGGNRLLACGRTGVAFSSDAGRTWETISTDGYYTLAADRRSGSGFLAGKDGRIARFKLPAEQ